jgi:hypothetical protein
MNTLLLQSTKIAHAAPCGKILFNADICSAAPPQWPLVHHGPAGVSACTATGIAFHEFDDLIIRCGLVPFGNSAACTAMNDNQTFLSRLIDAHGFHQPLTHGGTIAGVNVDVFGEEAERAVAAASTLFEWLHGRAAVLTREGFLAGKKSHKETEDERS